MKLKIWIVLPLLFVIASSIFNVIAYASLGTLGSEVYALTEKRMQVQKENDTLLSRLAVRRSLATVQQSANAIGFVPIGSLTLVQLTTKAVALNLTP